MIEVGSDSSLAGRTISGHPLFEWFVEGTPLRENRNDGSSGGVNNVDVSLRNDGIAEARLFCSHIAVLRNDFIFGYGLNF